MKRIGVLIFLAVLPSCKSAGDLRSRGAYAQATSQKAVDDLAGCIALAIAGRGMEIGRETLSDGVTVTAAMRPAGVKTVTNAYDIRDLGSARQVTLYVVGSKAGRAYSMPAAASACL